MADKKISELTALTGALNTADALPIADDSASQTKKISPKALLEQSFQLADDGSLPASKLSGTALPDGSVTTAKLADDSVTGAKLANSSSVVVSATQPTADFVGQGWLNTTDNKTYFWNGSSWVAHKAAGSINEILPDSSGQVFIEVTQTNDSVQLEGGLTDATAARQFLAGPTGTTGPVTKRQIVGDDLPAATDTEQGAVVVGSGSGLDVTGGSLSIDNTVVANDSSNLHVVQYNAHGLVVGGRKINGSDLPTADASELGAIKPGTGLTVDGDGFLNHTNSIPAATGTKVLFDGEGHITGTTNLLPEDIPAIPGDKITDDSLLGSSIKDRSITEIKLADYSTCLVQEGQPTGDFKLGQMWFTPSTSQLRVYGRGSSGDLWLSVGFGALQAQNLRWAGTVNADTSTITTLTDIGVSEGLTAGGPIPTPTDELSGLYFVVETAGSNITIPNVNGDLCTEGDWILYIDQAQGAIHLDIAAGGGGGGGASKLNDLTDVDLSGVSADQLLQYNAISGMWENVTPDFATTADIGDGTITITKSDGTEVGSFTVNQAGDTTIALPADVVPSDPNLQAVLDAGNSATTDLNIADGGQSVSLQSNGVVDASNLIRVNTNETNIREGMLVEGDLAVNTGSYNIRMHPNSTLSSTSGYSTIGKSATGETAIAESGGWGARYYFSASTTFVSISNDNPSGKPVPIPGADAVVHVYNGLNTQFGTEADPLGNVMPKDDWSSIPSLT